MARDIHAVPYVALFAKPCKPIYENTMNVALRAMGYDTNVDLWPRVPSHGVQCAGRVRAMVRVVIERHMSHKERNNVRAAYTHKAEFLEERRMIMT